LAKRFTESLNTSFEQLVHLKHLPKIEELLLKLEQTPQVSEVGISGNLLNNPHLDKLSHLPNIEALLVQFLKQKEEVENKQKKSKVLKFIYSDSFIITNKILQITFYLLFSIIIFLFIVVSIFS
jgi:hypothetical protein